MQFKIISSKFLSYFILAAFCFMVNSFAPAHKYYFSLTEIKADTFKKTITVSAKLFIDDFENVLQKNHHHKIDLSNSTENKEVQKVVFDYINKHLQVYLANKLVVLNFVGFEIENEVIWVYLESKLVDKEYQGVKIVNSLLYDFSTEQTNLIQFKWNNKNYTDKLIYPNKEIIIKP